MYVCTLSLTTYPDSDNPGRLLKTLDAKTARNRIQEALSEYFKAVRYGWDKVFEYINKLVYV